MPLTSPEPSTAILLLLVLHEPPAVPSVSDTVELAHTDDGPAMPSGDVLTTMLTVEIHPPVT